MFLFGFRDELIKLADKSGTLFSDTRKAQAQIRERARTREAAELLEAKKRNRAQWEKRENDWMKAEAKKDRFNKAQGILKRQYQKKPRPKWSWDSETPPATSLNRAYKTLNNSRMPILTPGNASKSPQLGPRRRQTEERIPKVRPLSTPKMPIVKPRKLEDHRYKTWGKITHI